MHGNEAYLRSKFEKKFRKKIKIKILEHFLKTRAGDRLGVEMSTKPKQNNNFHGPN